MKSAESVIGTIMRHGAPAYWRVADRVSPEDFPTPMLANLFRLCAKFAKAGTAMHFDIIAAEAGRLRICSEDEATSIATQTSGTVETVHVHAERVREDANRRRVQNVCREGARTGDANEVQAALADILSAEPSSTVSSRDTLDGVWSDFSTRYELDGEMSGLATGFPKLDEMTGGLQRGRVYGIGARPKVGKSVLAMNICLHIAMTGEKWVQVWSLELTNREWMQRAICSIGDVPGAVIGRPRLIDSIDGAQARMTEATRKLKFARIETSDRMDVTMEQIEAQARRLRAQGKLDLLCIDHIGLLRLPKADRHDLALAAVTRRAKIIAKELDVPVILVFQLNRSTEQGTAVRAPRPSDARDSGSIEQDLDAMLLLHRPTYYDPEAQKGCRLDLALHRNGPTGVIHLDDELRYFRFGGGESEWIDRAPSSTSDQQRKRQQADRWRVQR